ANAYGPKEPGVIRRRWLALGLGCLAIAALTGYLVSRAKSPRHKINGEIAMAETATVLEPADTPPGLSRATFGAGCFWCTEAVFQQLKGVSSVVSGYTGGFVKNPSYHHV